MSAIRQTIEIKGRSDMRRIRRMMSDESQSPPTLIVGGVAAYFRTWEEIESFIGALERMSAVPAEQELQPCN